MFSTQFLKINYLIFIVTFGGSGVPGWWKNMKNYAFYKFMKMGISVDET